MFEKLWIAVFALLHVCVVGEPTIVMSNGNGMWNTGVWAGFGEGPLVYLRWAGDGVVVDKSNCPHKCYFTQDSRKEGDVVVMETVNHPKFLMGNADSTPFPFAQRRSNQPPSPLTVMFYYEPSVYYPRYTTQMRDAFDIVMAPDAHSDLPVTMTCPWNHDTSAFVAPPDLSRQRRTIAYFSDGGIDPSYENWARWLMSELGEDLDGFTPQFPSRPIPPESKTVPGKIDLMSNYKFVLITESVALDDWVSPEFSQALVAGAIPVYLGAPNIQDFSPGNNSFVDVRQWFSRPPSELIDHLRAMAGDDKALSQYHAWKHQSGLSPQFREKLSQCVYYAECRLCALVNQRLASSPSLA